MHDWTNIWTTEEKIFCLGSLLRNKLDRVPSMIIACFILHNFAKSLNDPDFENEYEENDNVEALPFHDHDCHLRRLGEAKRLEIIGFLIRHEWRKCILMLSNITFSIGVFERIYMYRYNMQQ